MSKQKRALISGITGQDGSYLADLLLSKGYEVHGMVRRTSAPNSARIEHIQNLITLHPADLTDEGSIYRLIESIHPDEIYNLGAQSFVHASFEQPIATADMTGLGVTRMLEAIRSIDRNIKFYQASSSEMFGKVQETPQTERTPFYPRSPYGAAKMYGHWITVNYRESYNMFCVSGILYNHESPRRGIEFVTRKITKAIALIKCGKQKELRLGNLQAKRDWSHAKDMVTAMWMMLQNSQPIDYVVGSGECHTVEEFMRAAFEYVGLTWQDYVVIDPALFRPAEVDILLSDPSKIKSELGWTPTISFLDLVADMVESDMKLYYTTN